MLKTITIL